MTRALDRTRARYEPYAPAYKRHWAPVLRGLAQPLLRALEIDRRARVVDLGCGPGVISAALARRSGSVIGVDPTIGMLRLIPPSVRALGGEGERIPLNDASTDVVVTTFMLQHAPRTGAVFREIARVLTPGGVVATATWGAGTAEAGGPYDVAARELDRARAPHVPAVKTWHAKVDSPQKMSRHARRAGLEPVRAWTESLEWQWTEDHFMAWMTAARIYTARLDALEASERRRALERIARGVARLSADAMTWRPEVVYLIARR